MLSAGKKILVVEDDDDWTQLIRLWVEAAGYRETRYVSSAAEALRALRRFAPDCILTDLQLSDGDGFELCRNIRAGSGTGRTPIIVMTSYAEEKINALRCGADHFVDKRPDGKELLASLEAVFRRRDLDMGLERHGDLALDPERLTVFLDGRPAAELTPKTFALLRLLVKRSPSPVDRKEILELIEFREEPSLSRALDILVNRLRKALPEKLRRRINSVRAFGYMYLAPAR